MRWSNKSVYVVCMCKKKKRCVVAFAVLLVVVVVAVFTLNNGRAFCLCLSEKCVMMVEW